MTATAVKAAKPTSAKAAKSPAPVGASAPSRRRGFTPLTPMRQQTASSIRRLAGHMQQTHPGMSTAQHLRDAAKVLESGNEEAAQRHLRAAAFTLSPQSLMRHGLHTDDAHIAAREGMHGVHRHLLLVKDITDAHEKNQAAINRDSYGDNPANLPPRPEPQPDPNAGYGPGALAQKPTARQPGGNRALNAPARTNSGGSDPNVADPVGPQPKGSKQFARSWDELAGVIALTGDGRGNHIPGTPFEWEHGYIPLTPAAATSHFRGNIPKGWTPRSGGGKGPHPADKLTVAGDPGEAVKSMDTGDLRAADAEFGRRAAALGKPGQLSKAHKAVRDELKARSGEPAGTQHLKFTDASGRDSYHTVKDRETADNLRKQAAARNMTVEEGDKARDPGVTKMPKNAQAMHDAALQAGWNVSHYPGESSDFKFDAQGHQIPGSGTPLHAVSAHNPVTGKTVRQSWKGNKVDSHSQGESLSASIAQIKANPVTPGQLKALGTPAGKLARTASRISDDGTEFSARGTGTNAQKVGYLMGQASDALRSGDKQGAIGLLRQAQTHASTGHEVMAKGLGYAPTVIGKHLSALGVKDQQLAYSWDDLAAVLEMAASAPARVIDLVGPHGYIHGWIFVGIPGAGQKVTFGAGKHATGTVEGADATHVHVRMGDGSVVHVAHTGQGSGQLARIPTAVPAYKSDSAQRNQVAKSLTMLGRAREGTASSPTAQRVFTEQAQSAVSGSPRLESDEVLSEHLAGMRASLEAGDQRSFAAHLDAAEARIRQHGMMPAGDDAKPAAPRKPTRAASREKQLDLLGERMTGGDTTSGLMHVGGMQEGHQAIGQAPAGIVGGMSDPWWMAGPNGQFAVSARSTSGKRVLIPWGADKQAEAEDRAMKATTQYSTGYVSGGSNLQQALARTVVARTQHQAALSWDDVAAVVELSARTAALEVTPAPYGKPGGPGLYDVKGLQHTPYFQQVVKALMEKRGMDKGRASAIAYGALRKWAGGGGNVHPEVRAAAAGALAGEKAAGAAARAAHGHAVTRDQLGRVVQLATVLDFYNPAGNPGQARVPTGQPQAGQFTKGQSQQQQAQAKGKGKQAPVKGGKPNAHQQHVAHVAHVQHKAKEKAGLLQTAKNDRAQASALIKQRAALQKALASASGKTSSGQSGSTTSANATTSSSAPAAASTAASAPAAAGASSASSTPASGTSSSSGSMTAAQGAQAQAQIDALTSQINGLLKSAQQATAQAAKLN